MKPRVITVDGPSGVGKGTVCGHLANRLGWHLLDSGSLYRLTGLAVRQDHGEFNNPSACALTARSLNPFVSKINPDYESFLSGDEVTQAIRTEQAGQGRLGCSGHSRGEGRTLGLATSGVASAGLIADGRDMGTVVFPDAGLKLYLDASCEERARRRYNQLRETDKTVTLATVLQDLQARDDRDSSREAAPLKPAADARVLEVRA